jgi:hypothetical protein
MMISDRSTGSHAAPFLVNKGFTPRMIAALEPRIREIATSLPGRLPDGRPLRPDARPGHPTAGDGDPELLGVEPERRVDSSAGRTPSSAPAPTTLTRGPTRRATTRRWRSSPPPGAAVERGAATAR